MCRMHTARALSMDQIVRSATGSLILCSGGLRIPRCRDREGAHYDGDGRGRNRLGRNIWQREHTESLRLAERLRALLEQYPPERAPAFAERALRSSPGGKAIRKRDSVHRLRPTTAASIKSPAGR